MDATCPVHGQHNYPEQQFQTHPMQTSQGYQTHPTNPYPVQSGPHVVDFAPVEEPKSQKGKKPRQSFFRRHSKRKICGFSVLSILAFLTLLAFIVWIVAVHAINSARFKHHFFLKAVSKVGDERFQNLYVQEFFGYDTYQPDFVLASRHAPPAEFSMDGGMIMVKGERALPIFMTLPAPLNDSDIFFDDIPMHYNVVKAQRNVDPGLRIGRHGHVSHRDYVGMNSTFAVCEMKTTKRAFPRLAWRASIDQTDDERCGDVHLVAQNRPVSFWKPLDVIRGLFY